MTVTQRSTLGLNITAYEKLMRFALRPELHYDGLADVKPTNLTNRGATVDFPLMNDLAAATTPLNEVADVTPVPLDDDHVQVSLAEYGNAVKTSAFLRATAYMEVNPFIPNVLGFNAGLSTDTIARNAAVGGTNVRYVGAPGNADRDEIDVASTLTGNDVRFVVAKLRGANVRDYNGLYAGHIHPDVSYDFRGATGGTNWSDPHVYSAPEAIFNGTIGAFQGVRFMEHSRAPLFPDAGNGSGAAGTIDVYATIIHGREGIAKAYSNGDAYGQDPVFVESPVTDNLRRFTGAGWKHLVGYGVFRQAALWRIESSSSIGANT